MQKPKVKVVMEPCPMQEDGSFLDRFCQALRKVGNVEIRGRLAPRNASNVLSADWIILNWWEDEYFKRSKLRRWVATWLLKLSRARKAVVFHNKQPHECTPEKKTYYKKLLDGAYRIVLLTEASRKNLAAIIGEEEAQRKGIVVHHPNYDVKPKIWGEKPDDRFKVLFFGLLRPYKNIELLVEIAKKHPEIDFIIAGDTYGNEEYGIELRNKCSSICNITLLIRYLSDRDIDNLIDWAHIICLPYNMNSSQNSGSAIYAFSKNINVIIPEIETILELKNRHQVFCYRYLEGENHFDKVESVLLNALEEYKNNYKKFINRTIDLNSEILSDNSIECVARQIKSVLK